VDRSESLPIDDSNGCAHGALPDAAGDIELIEQFYNKSRAFARHPVCSFDL
jgi:hypothetical protein